MDFSRLPGASTSLSGRSPAHLDRGINCLMLIINIALSNPSFTPFKWPHMIDRRYLCFNEVDIYWYKSVCCSDYILFVFMFDSNDSVNMEYFSSYILLFNNSMAKNVSAFQIDSFQMAQHTNAYLYDDSIQRPLMSLIQSKTSALSRFSKFGAWWITRSSMSYFYKLTTGTLYSEHVHIFWTTFHKHYLSWAPILDWAGEKVDSGPSLCTATNTSRITRRAGPSKINYQRGLFIYGRSADT